MANIKFINFSSNLETNMHMKTLSELVDKSVKKTAFFVIVLSSNMKKSFQSIYVGHTLTAINVKIFPHFVWIWLMGYLHFQNFP